MDLKFLFQFVGMVWNIGTANTDVPPPLITLYNQYMSDSRTETIKALGFAQNILEKNNKDECAGLRIGLLMGVLLSNTSQSFDGKRMLQEILDTNYQNKKNHLQSNGTIPRVGGHNEPQVDVIKGVDEWLKKFNK